MATPTPSATPGVSNRLGTILTSNMSGLIIIITAFSLTFVFVSLFIRVYVRSKNGPWKNDDTFLLAASVLSCVQIALVFFEVGKGLGKQTDTIGKANLDAMQKAVFAADIFYILVSFCSKASLAFLYLRLTQIRAHSLAIWAILGTCVVWAVMSIMIVSIGCHVGDPWATWDTQCANFIVRWGIIGTMDILTEAALILVSILLVKDVLMSWKAKALVVGAFGCRILLVPAIILRLHYLAPTTLPAHRNLAASYATVCAQLQLGYGIFAATVPCLKPFVAVWEDNSGGNGGEDRRGDYDNGMKAVGVKDGMGGMGMEMGKGGAGSSSRVLVEQEERDEMNEGRRRRLGS